MDRAISFIQPSRSNLKYLKWSYESIRKNLGYRHEICMADDFSDDGTWEWMLDISKKDPNVKIHRNEGPTRLGHTILYDTLINDYATNDIVMIYHADMYSLPNFDTEILKHIKPGVVVSGTRIEPPLHPQGPEKVLMDFGIEPEEFKENELLDWFSKEYKPQQETTEGIFAPWAIYKDDFQKIGGHDPLYAPQSKEDSDIFNRFILAGYEVVQTRRGCVYHMTCRGSRFADGAKRNPDGQVFMKNRETDEWLTQNIRSTRNFIRKWGTMVEHDEYLKPIITPMYSIGYELTEAADVNTIRNLEPYCQYMVVPAEQEIKQYIEQEQPNTQYKLSEKFGTRVDDSPNYDIKVVFNPWELTQQSFQILTQLNKIIKDSGEEGQRFQIDIFDIWIEQMVEHQEDNIVCNSN
jgi:glycosyltransferase involved in cell wall biosynthesis